MMSPPTFRRDIQGLRGVAVLLVVLFHAGVGGFDGGFVGVDVFFVISGFVIARSFAREHEETGSVRLLAFYRRRVRRLAPALVAMLVVVLPLSALLIEIGDVQANAAATAAAALFAVANLRLLHVGDDYFAVADDTNPFLHTWSLGVEEQFYVVAPLVVVLVLAAARRTRWRGPTLVAAVMAALAVLSFVISVTWVSSDDTHRAFYSPVSRWWEIAVGVVLALRPTGDRAASTLRRWRDGPWPTVWVAAATAALGLVVVTYDGATRFPGLAALVPVAATAILIELAPRSPAAAMVLGHRALTWIGDRSYGWYLWHWPLMVFVRHGLGLGTWAAIGAAVVAIGPAAWSYRRLERTVAPATPHRIKPRLAVGLVAAMAVVVGQSVALAAGADRNWGIEGDERPIDGVAFTSDCHPASLDRLDECTLGPPGASGLIVVIGDSHAAALVDGIAEAATRLDRRTVSITADSCPFVLLEPGSPCDDLRARAWEAIAELRPELIVVAHHSPAYVRDARVARLRRADGSSAGSTEEGLALWAEAHRRSVAEAERLDAELVVVASVPVYPSESRGPILLDRRPLGITMGVAQLADERAAAIDAERSGLGGPGRLIDPLPALCPTGSCSQQGPDGRWWYFDRGHLNRTGSLVLADLFALELAARL